jgi:hypothetical protein
LAGVIRNLATILSLNKLIKLLQTGLCIDVVIAAGDVGIEEYTEPN